MVQSAPYGAVVNNWRWTVMADDRSKRGAQDRRTVAGSERYELNYEAEKLGISPDQLKAIIARVGTDRAKIEEAAGRIKK
jgi:Protein of unknown function (DUF3606)